MTPARDVAVVKEGAGVIEACRHMHGRSSCAQGVCEDWRVTVGGCAITELPFVIPAPTRHVAVVEEGAGVSDACTRVGNGHRRSTCWERNG